jgi:tripartite-type tricarboxylate transporter receptor subunit TctC
MFRLTALLLAFAAPTAFAANYATCILDKAPGAVNDIAAQAVHQVCLKENPGAIQAVPQGSGRGLMGYNSGAECVVAKAKDTRSNQAAAMIGVACRKLYDESPKLTPFNGKLDGER